MTYLLLTGVNEELEPFLNRFEHDFHRETRLYSFPRFPGLWAGSTGPGVRKRSAFLRTVRSLRPDCVILCGLTGVLERRDAVAEGEPLPINRVVDGSTGKAYLAGGEGDTLVSIRAPLYDADEKEDLALRLGARVCDMEGYVLLDLLAPLSVPVRLCKVAGDRPEDRALYDREHLVRSWSRKSLREKCTLLFRFPGGTLPLFRLLKKKRKMLERLADRMTEGVLSLYGEAPEPSFFSPVFGKKER